MTKKDKANRLTKFIMIFWSHINIPDTGTLSKKKLIMTIFFLPLKESKANHKLGMENQCNVWRLKIHLRSSEAETSFDPSEDHANRKIEPSCPTSLHVWTALYSGLQSWRELWILLIWGTTFHTMICPSPISKKQKKIYKIRWPIYCLSLGGGWISDPILSFKFCLIIYS